MKILQVVASMDPVQGGICQGVRNSVSEHQKSGVHTDIVSMDDPTDAFLEEEPLSVFAVGPGLGTWGYSSQLLPWLEKNLANYDVVIVNGLWQYYSFAVTKVLRALRKEDETSVPELYIMTHGMLDPYFQKAPSRKLKAVRNYIYWNLIENKSVSSATGLLFTCEEELKLARNTFPNYAPRQEYNVGYGVPQPPECVPEMAVEFKKACPELTGPFLLFLSRIHPKKGVDLLVEAYARWLETGGTEKPSLVIAGPGLDTQYGNKLLKIIAENPSLKGKVFFTGMVKGLAKWGAFYGSEAFILPSHQENFGIAVVEALACGKPVLISNKVNIWREIEAGEAGIVTSDTLEGAYGLLNDWGQLDRAGRDRMEENAIRAYKENFSIAKAAQQMLEAVS